MRSLNSKKMLLAILVSFLGQRSLSGQEAVTVAPAGQVLMASSASSGIPVLSEPALNFSAMSKGAFRYRGNFDLFWTQTSPPPKVNKPPAERLKRATINPSMVGYIDNAGIHSEVRIRFDAALHNDTPDRAEFFYAKCGCYRNPPTNSINYDANAPGPGPGVPQYVNFQQLYLQAEYAIKPRFSFFTQIPIRWLQPHGPAGAAAAFSNGSGISDVQLGLKLAAVATPRSYLTFQLRSTLPSGDAFSGLGTNHASIEPAILYYQQITNRFSVEGQIGDTHPIGGSRGVPTASSSGFAGDVFFYGIGPSYLLINRENFHLSPVVELVGWNVISGFATNRTSTSGVNIVNLKIGPRMTFGAHSSFYAGYGIALTSQTWYREIFRTEYRYSF